VAADTWGVRPSSMIGIPPHEGRSLFFDIIAAQHLLSEKNKGSPGASTTHSQQLAQIDPEMMAIVEERIEAQRKGE